MPLDPLVTVIVPVLNDDAMLPATVRCVARQGVSNIEVLIAQKSDYSCSQYESGDPPIEDGVRGRQEAALWTIVTDAARTARGEWLAFAEPGALWPRDHLWAAISGAERLAANASMSCHVAPEAASTVWISDSDQGSSLITAAEVMDGTWIGLSTLVCRAETFWEIVSDLQGVSDDTFVGLLLRLSATSSLVRSHALTVWHGEPAPQSVSHRLDGATRLETYRGFLAWLLAREHVRDDRQ